MDSFGSGFSIRVIKKAVFATFTCIFALEGALVGIVIGATKGQTAETGFLHGSGLGAVAGAVTAVQLLEAVANSEPWSKVALIYSLVSGKVFMEWMSAMETENREISDIYDRSGNRGLSNNCIQSLPQLTFQSIHKFQPSHQFCCTICLQDLKDGDLMRKLPNCGHLFHLDCLDKWLTRNGSCPMCRNHVF